MFNRIVAGCDGKPAGRDAAALGAVLAEATGSGLSLAGVFPTSLLPIEGVTDRRTSRKLAEQELRRQRDRFAPDALIHAIPDGSVARALRHYVDHWHAGLVVVGSRATAHEGRAEIGRDARQLIFDAPFGLAVARRGFADGNRRIGRIAVGYDGGPESEAAVDVAQQLARACHAVLKLRMVAPGSAPALGGPPAADYEDWNDLVELERAHAMRLVEEKAESLRAPVETSATIGDPGYELRALSEESDLIVVGSRRWGMIARLVAGGVGETLVADSGCSVVLVPRPKAAVAPHGNALPATGATV